MKRPPTFVGVIVAVVLVGLLLVGLGAWQVVEIDRAETRRDCDRAVATRNDGRAMWLYLLETSTRDRATIDTFAAKLDELLPPLKCVGGNPLPDRPE